MKRKILYILFLVLTLLPASFIYAEIRVGIDDSKLGNTIPDDLEFIDESGNKVKLKELMDKPTVLALVYYRCPGICTPLLNELQRVVDKVPLEPLQDFKVITISFDPGEKPITAAAKKQSYLKRMKRDFPKEAWRFLTGDKENIRKITEAVGFYYIKENTKDRKSETTYEYKHEGGIAILSPEGKIARYLLGLEYLPFNLKMAIVEAAEGRVGPTLPSRFLQFCFSYDPRGRTYVLNIIRITGVATLLFVLTIATVLLRAGKKSKNIENVEKGSTQ